MPNADDVKQFVKVYLGDRAASAGVSDFSDGLHLIESGLIDSFGLMDLVGAVEKKFAIEVDIGDVDIETFTTFGGFVATVAGRPG